jgi:hypothetical protein
MTSPSPKDRPKPVLPPLAAEDFSCAVCHVSYPEAAVEDAVSRLALYPDRARRELSGLDRDQMRRRPAANVWSGMEYLCHVRDVFVTATIRLYRSQTEETPAIEPMFNDLRAARFSYDKRDLDAVLAELADNAEGFLEEVARVSGVGWERRIRRLPGEYRTARWLVLQTWHEAEHHLRDILDGVAP